jgi:hypothetical protein
LGLSAGVVMMAILDVSVCGWRKSHPSAAEAEHNMRARVTKRLKEFGKDLERKAQGEVAGIAQRRASCGLAGSAGCGRAFAACAEGFG